MLIEVSEQKIEELLNRFSSHPSVHEAIMDIVRPENLKFKTVDLSPMNPDLLVQAFTSAGLQPLIEVRMGGQFVQRAFLLTSSYHWDIVKENGGNTLLIPTKRPAPQPQQFQGFGIDPAPQAIQV